MDIVQNIYKYVNIYKVQTYYCLPLNHALVCSKACCTKCFFFLNGRCYHVSYVGASILQTTNNRGESWRFSDINLTITIIQYTGQKSSVLAQS